jgi:hypothetical protein
MPCEEGALEAASLGTSSRGKPSSESPSQPACGLSPSTLPFPLVAVPDGPPAALRLEVDAAPVCKHYRDQNHESACPDEARHAVDNVPACSLIS